MSESLKDCLLWLYLAHFVFGWTFGLLGVLLAALIFISAKKAKPQGGCGLCAEHTDPEIPKLKNPPPRPDPTLQPPMFMNFGQRSRSEKRHE